MAQLEALLWENTKIMAIHSHPILEFHARLSRPSKCNMCFLLLLSFSACGLTTGQQLRSNIGAVVCGLTTQLVISFFLRSFFSRVSVEVMRGCFTGQSPGTDFFILACFQFPGVHVVGERVPSACISRADYQDTRAEVVDE